MNHIPFNREAFREARDKFVTDSIIQRKADLERDSKSALQKAKALRKKFKAMPKGHARDLAENDYDVAMAEWAIAECEIGNIIRDSRYIAHMAKLTKG